jgi:hypothetical protein
MTHSDERNRPMMPAIKPYVVLITYPVVVSRVQKKKKKNIREHVIQGIISMFSDRCDAKVGRIGRVE